MRKISVAGILFGITITLVLPALILTSNVLADPHCRKCPYDCSDLGLGRKECSEIPEVRGLCCVDLTKYGLKLAQEQERVLGASDNKPEVRETCPSGFSPSEQKCSKEERRRGCKDMRLPGGLGCVRR